MPLSNILNEQLNYDSLNDNSTDIQRLDVFFSILSRQEHGEYVSTHKLKLKRSDQMYFEAILNETGLAFDDSGMAEQTRFKLNSKGIVVLKKFGSYSNYLQHLQKEFKEQSSKSEERDNLEMQQLRTDNILKTNQLVDYETTKRHLRYSMIANIILVLITFVQLLLLIIKK
jgi:hypothetical protein